MAKPRNARARSRALARTSTGNLETRRNDPVTLGPDSAPGEDADLAGAAGASVAGVSGTISSDRPGTAPLGVLLAVPTRGYPWYETAQALAPYNPQYVKEKLSVASVRNKIVRDFLKTKADVLVMCDDDVIPGPDWLEKMLSCPYDVVGAAVPIAKMPQHPVFINAFNYQDDGAIMTCELPNSGHRKVDGIGTGLIVIHRRVLEHPEMKRPFEQELDEDGVILIGQDLQFCRRLKTLGFSVGVSVDALCDHFVSLHANAISVAYANATRELLEAQKE